MSIDRAGALLLTVVVAALAGCGGGGAGDDDVSEQPQGQPQGGQQTMPAGGDSASGGEPCDDIPVPGHEGTNVRVEGIPCAEAVEVVGAAVGKGRQAYEAAGFSCEPSPAGGGDTTYACTRDGARVTFRYGAA